MNTHERKTIDRQTYLLALACFTAAKRHSDRAVEFANELAKVLGREDYNDLDHLGDEIWTYPGTHWGFEEALKLAGFDFDPAAEVAKEPEPRP